MPDEAVLTETARWWQYAKDDLATADLLHATQAPSRHVCLHAQQAAEKALKCLLIFQNLSAPKAHDLGYLQQRLPQTLKTAHLPVRELEALSHWAVESRYPGEETEADSRDAAIALATAHHVMDASKPI